jgi:error-prone DNA polymerase
VRGRLQRAGLVVHVVAESFIDLSQDLHRLRDGDILSNATYSNLPLVKSRDFH